MTPENSNCHYCQVSLDNRRHTYQKNHTGSAGSIESTGILEAAPEKYVCYCMEYIHVGNGDSTVADIIM